MNHNEKYQVEDLIRSGIRLSRDTEVRGIFIFGSTARQENKESSDIDVGIVYNGKKPDFEEGMDPRLDVFFWNESQWTRGFALQLAMVDSILILYDPELLIQQRIFLLKKSIPDSIFGLLTPERLF